MGQVDLLEEQERVDLMEKLVILDQIDMEILEIMGQLDLGDEGVRLVIQGILVQLGRLVFKEILVHQVQLGLPDLLGLLVRLDKLELLDQLEEQVLLEELDLLEFREIQV